MSVKHLQLITSWYTIAPDVETLLFCNFLKEKQCNVSNAIKSMENPQQEFGAALLELWVEIQSEALLLAGPFMTRR